MISIIIPVIRPERVKRCLKAIAENTKVKHEVVMEEDTERIGAPLMVKRLVNATKYDWVCFLGDDTIPQPRFLENALSAATELPDGWGLVGINDNLRLLWDKGMANMRRAAAHWIAHKNLLPFLDGEFFHTGYKHCYCDNELMDRCTALDRYVFAEDSMVFHEHPLADESFNDSDYERVYNNSVYIYDLTLYRRRRAKGWKSE